MSQDPAHYVSHPRFTRDQLHARQLAVCRAGAPTRCTINCSPARPEDNKYIVTLAFGLSLVPLGPESPSALGKVPLDQLTVEKIEAVEKGSPLARMRFEFAILQDAISGALTMDDTPKVKLESLPPIPLDQTVTFDRTAAT